MIKRKKIFLLLIFVLAISFITDFCEGSITECNSTDVCKNEETIVVDWVWMGAVTASSIRINVGLNISSSMDDSHLIWTEGKSDSEWKNLVFLEVQSLTNDQNQNANENWKESFSNVYYPAQKISIQPSISVTSPSVENFILHFHIDELPFPDTHYNFQVKRLLQNNKETKNKNTIDTNKNDIKNDKRVLSMKKGSFQSLGSTGSAWNFSFAFSSCMNAKSNGSVFDHMASIHEHANINTKREKLALFIHLGDLHYDNNYLNNLTRYRESMWHAIGHTQAGQSMLNMNLPMAYMYDDHDFGDNNCDRFTPGRPSALQTYRDFVPHYPLDQSPSNRVNHELRIGGSLHQSFLIGSVLFILTDLQSQRSPHNMKDNANKTMLGPVQKEWFKRQILLHSYADSNTDNKQVQMIVWCSTTPWIDDERKWFLYNSERKDIVSFLKQTHDSMNRKLQIPPLVIVSGDAHMIAVDDGTYSFGNIPVFQAAALGRNGKIKGGPYSHGVFPGIGQYGEINVQDFNNGTICLQFTGFSVSPPNHSSNKETVNYSNSAEVQTYNTCTKQSLHPDSLYVPPPIYIRKIQRFIKRRKKSIIRFYRKMKSIYHNAKK